MSKIVVLSSGGLDSTVLLYKAVKEHGKANVMAINMFYRQRHDKELECFKWQMEHLGIENYQQFDLSTIFTNDNNCKLFKWNGDVPQGTYAEQKPEGGTVETYVPFRNGLFLAVAASIAEQLGYDEVWCGVHRDDVAGEAYPDCSAQFINDMGNAIRQGTAAHIRVAAPWVNFTKAEVVGTGVKLGMTEEEFSHTWSCYEGGDKPCGTCATCIDRAKAFEANGLRGDL